MRRIAPLLVLACLARAGDPVVVEEVGLAIDIPEGWSRETRREKESIRFAALYDHTKKLYVRFQVETSGAAGYDAAAWLADQKQAMAKLFKQVEEPFAPEKGLAVGGKDAAAFTCSGRVVQGEDEYDLRLRVAGLVHSGAFFKITEVSYNKAHAEEEVADAIARMWQGIRFQEPKLPAVNLDVPEGAQEEEVLDEAGNFKLKVPPGWEIKQSPNQGDKTGLRAVLSRSDPQGNGLVSLWVFRWESANTSMFATGTAGDVISSLAKDDKIFEQFYGKGSADFIHPRVNEGVSLGGVDKAGAYEYRSITMDEQEAIREAENKQRRGEKGIEVPTFQETVVRGRIALLSPGIYLAMAHFRTDMADDPDLLKEFNRALDSWEFLVGEPIPPALQVNGEEFGDTTADPANQKERKDSCMYSETGRKTHRCQDEFVLPPGFQRIKTVGGNLAAGIVAQDAKHNSVQIMILHVSSKRVGEENKVLEDKARQFASWKSNWETKAKNTKIPKDTKKFRLGNLSGEGYQNLEGTVDQFRATFTGLLEDKSGWRTIIEVETRAKGDIVFEEGLQRFLKSWKVKPVK